MKMETTKINGSMSMEETVCTLQETLADRYYKLSNSKMRVLREYVAVTARLLAPYVVAVCHAWLRHQRALIAGLRQNIVTVVIATITSRFSLRLVSVGQWQWQIGELLCGTSKLDPLLRTFRVINFRPRQLLWSPEKSTVANHEPEKSVHCQVLYDPGPGRITADVIFIHGLKGSLDRTWKQGIWDLKDCDRRSRVLLRKSCSTTSIGEKRRRGVGRRLGGSEGDLILSSIREDAEKMLLENNNTITVEDKVVFTCGNEQDANSNSDEGFDETMTETATPTVITSTTTTTSILSSPSSVTTTTTTTTTTTKTDASSMTEKQSDENVSLCWPRDWLPQDCPGVRVIALNYTTDPYLWRPVWISKRSRTSMQERGWEMIEHLVKLGVGNNPIVWVGHSKGGLFVKQMLVHGCESKIDAYSNISRNTKGIVFYSVPHRGSPLANLNLPLLRQSIELTEVQKNSADVLELHKKFHSLLERNQIQVEVRSFIETTLTLMSLFYVRIVSVESADAEVGDFYGVPTDHRNICKPRSRNCFLYKELVDLVQSVGASKSKT